LLGAGNEAVAGGGWELYQVFWRRKAEIRPGSGGEICCSGATGAGTRRAWWGKKRTAGKVLFGDAARSS